MKKLLIAGVATAALVSPAFAQGSGQFTGVVQPTCEVQDLFAQQSFASLSAGQSITDGFTILCNDEDAATLKMTSVGGGLRSDDNSDDIFPGDPSTVVTYTATVTGTGISAYDLTLVTDGTPDDFTEGSADAFDASALASGVPGTVTITLDEDALWAGGYSDTIQLDVIAN